MDLPLVETVDRWPPRNVARRWLIGIDDSLADCERIRIIGPKFSSVRILCRPLAVLLVEEKRESFGEKISRRQSTGWNLCRKFIKPTHQPVFPLPLSVSVIRVINTSIDHKAFNCAVGLHVMFRREKKTWKSNLRAATCCCLPRPFACSLRAFICSHASRDFLG